MKKFLSILAIALCLFGISMASTGDLRDWMDNLNDEIPFGYAVSQKISVSSISLDKITLSSPVIEDELGNEIQTYTVMFSQYPLSQILEDTSLLDEAKEKTFEFSSLGSSLSMDLVAADDGLSTNTVYYVSVIPKDENGILGEISNELRFKLATQSYGEGTPTDATTAHSSAGADMSLANITHTISNNNVTLRWTSVDGSDTVDIFLWNPTSQTFERLSSVSMGAESYTFPLTRNGEYIVNFMPNNGGTEYRYTFTANGVTATSAGTTTSGQPVIGKIPATGPKENILVALAIAFVLYLVYRKAKAKH